MSRAVGAAESTPHEPQEKSGHEHAHWTIYILRCADDTLYTGIARDALRRLDEHNNGPRAASYTRARRPVLLIYRESAPTRSAAAKREHQIKRMSRREKELLVAGTAASGQK